MTRSSGWKKLLWPLSVLYATGSKVRIWCYSRGIFRTRRLPGTVISIGNLTVGGTGKTPLVLRVAERLAEEGKKTAILTRGYRGVADSSSQGLPQSDEVALLRRRLAGKVQIGVGPDRYKNGQVLANHRVEWFILDDGFQHLKLARDADVVVVDATDAFGGGMVLPAGRLRERVSALRRADVIVITRSVQEPSPAVEAVIRRHTQCPIFYTTTRLESVLRVPQLAVTLPEREWKSARFMAFCAIGNPPAFFDDLRKWGIQVLGKRGFSDHHVYTKGEVGDLERAAARCGADGLLCTEKDVWNLRNVSLAGMPVYCCRISFDLPEQFWIVLNRVILHNQIGVAQ